MVKKFFICCFLAIFCFAEIVWAGELDQSEKRYQEIVNFISDGQMNNVLPLEQLLTNKKISKQEICWAINHFVEKAGRKSGYEKIHIPNLTNFAFADMEYINDLLGEISKFESNGEYSKDDFAENYFIYTVLHIRESFPGVSVDTKSTWENILEELQS